MLISFCIFDDKKSLIHFIYGYLSGAFGWFWLFHRDYVGLALSFLMVMVFIVYQMLELESLVCKVFDFVEMVSGFVVGVLLPHPVVWIVKILNSFLTSS